MEWYVYRGCCPVGWNRNSLHGCGSTKIWPQKPRYICWPCGFQARKANEDWTWAHKIYENLWTSVIYQWYIVISVTISCLISCLDLFKQRAVLFRRPCRPLGRLGMAQMLRTLDPQWRMASSLGSTLASILDEIHEVFPCIKVGNTMPLKPLQPP